jgi:hypothetical protein
MHQPVKGLTNSLYSHIQVVVSVQVGAGGWRAPLPGVCVVPTWCLGTLPSRGKQIPLRAELGNNRRRQRPSLLGTQNAAAGKDSPMHKLLCCQKVSASAVNIFEQAGP